MTQAENFATLSRVIAAIQAGEVLSKELWLDDAKKSDSYVLEVIRAVFRTDSSRFTNQLDIRRLTQPERSTGLIVVPPGVVTHGHIRH